MATPEILCQLVLLCRPGLEGDCAAEIIDHAAQAGLPGWCRALDGQGVVFFRCHETGAQSQLFERISFENLVFPRQWFLAADTLQALNPENRIAGMTALINQLPLCGDAVVITPDTNDGKSLGKLATALAKPLQQAMKQYGKWRDGASWRATLLLLTGTSGCFGIAPLSNSAPWPAGIPRLRFPRQAPSRSTLKLEEAFHVFFPDKTQWHTIFKPGDRAIDLGAAPGGWTWQLLQRGLSVTAVDNGPLDASLFEEGHIDHQRADAFTYEPRKPVRWMVCDIVDKPARVTDLVIRWFTLGWCRDAIFNLKLPMKQRYRETAHLLDRLVTRCEKQGIHLQVRAKQLYHDREEITVHASRIPLDQTSQN